MGEAVAVVLAAGQGKRMRSALPKVLHEVGGRPMLVRVLEAVRASGIVRAVVVVGHGGDRIQAAMPTWSADLEPLTVACVHQAAQRGTGDAVATALPQLAEQEETVVVAPADVPLLPAADLTRLLSAHRAQGAACTLLTSEVPDPSGYGRIVRQDGAVAGIIEERDCSTEQKRITEINSGIMCLQAAWLRRLLPLLSTDNAQGEILLTDVIGLLRQAGAVIAAEPAADWEKVAGVNDRQALAASERALEALVRSNLADRGVVLRGHRAGSVDDRARIGEGCVLGPLATIEGMCVIGAGTQISQAVVQGSVIGARCRIGPMAALRPARH